MAFGPLSSHSRGVVRSPSELENTRLFSGVNAHCAGSGGGADVTARSSFPYMVIKIDSRRIGLVTYE